MGQKKWKRITIQVHSTEDYGGSDATKTLPNLRVSLKQTVPRQGCIYIFEERDAHSLLRYEAESVPVPVNASVEDITTLHVSLSEKDLENPTSLSRQTVSSAPLL